MNSVSNSGPALVVANDQLTHVDTSPSDMLPIPGSRMFEINEALKVYLEREPDGTVFDASQGDGGASLPGVSRELLEEAHRLQLEHGTGYDKPFGTPAFRRAVVEDYWGLDAATGWGPANVIACQGGRDALVKAYDAIQFLGHQRRGDFVVVSRVPWISYNWGPYAMGANVMLAPGLEEDAWALTPEGIAACAETAAAFDGRRLALLVITSPDNPTGRSMSPEGQIALARAAFAAGVPFVLFDWIYHRVTDEEPYDLNAFLGALEPAERERCIFLDGLTKSLGASNIRNAHLVASEPIVKFIQGRASHAVIPTFHSQAVAIAAYRMGFDRAAAGIIGPTNASRTDRRGLSRRPRDPPHPRQGLLRLSRHDAVVGTARVWQTPANSGPSSPSSSALPWSREGFFRSSAKTGFVSPTPATRDHHGGARTPVVRTVVAVRSPQTGGSR